MGDAVAVQHRDDVHFNAVYAKRTIMLTLSGVMTWSGGPNPATLPSFKSSTRVPMEAGCSGLWVDMTIR